ncbi:hypothetical protein G4V62_16015 [Bacillaceae bacterium SIJ1]|uniref:AraC family ligand binding domain-containing protein n=1 Tax=Litoribacterium kuwaitense TaxID=1398745 RepID=UPI0013EC0A72|nr:AraC family ligand binding domain-containing protein [Litoribacterium kuwaitense]NGP46378.1 hypothetical protein [Litoribacterium kuwaitense]
MNFTEVVKRNPVTPYVRECDFAIRNPWSMSERRLLDYLLIYVREGKCNFTVDGKNIILRRGIFALFNRIV